LKLKPKPDLISEKITLQNESCSCGSLVWTIGDGRINAIAAKHNLLVVEDAAQSHGAMAIKKQ
jgi:dTDP-4-amino-4,6-dideoxygalactose transaminase